MAEVVHLRMPSKSDSEEMSEILGLSQDKAARLWTVVENLVGDIMAHQELRLSSPDARTRKTRLRATIDAFERLSAHLNSEDSALTVHLVRAAVLPALGGLLTFDGLSRLTGSWIDSAIDEGELRDLSRDGRGIDASDIDGLTRAERQGIAARIGPRLVQRLIEILTEPLRRQLDLVGLGKSGAPERSYRNHVIKVMAELFPDLYEKRPTSTPSGPFLTLCEQVMGAIGMDSTGLDDAVIRLLRHSRRPSA